MTKRKNFVCMLRPAEKNPNGVISRNERDNILIEHFDMDEMGLQRLECNQKDARLIAKRINQFLDNGG